MKFDRHNWRSVVALVPQYDEWGHNGTQIWLTDGSIIYDTRKVDTVVRELAGVFAVDVTRLRQICREELGRGRNVPLVLQRELWLIPVVCRQVLSRHDGARGYLVYQQVASLEGSGKESVVHFRQISQTLVLPEGESSVRWSRMLTEMVGEKVWALF